MIPASAGNLSQEEVSALMAAYTGYGLMNKEQDLSHVGYIWLNESVSLRERVFARLVKGLMNNEISFKHAPQQVTIYPQSTSCKSFLKACLDNSSAKELLSVVPFRCPRPHDRANDELYPWLQDLALLITSEVTQSYVAKYFPGLPDVVVPDDHVVRVMEAMQRELYREGDGGHRGHAIQLAELPWERQKALAERRRFWYGKFGITPETWAAGVFSLWDVSEGEMPPLEMIRI